MATQKEVLETLHSKGEILYWAKSNNIPLEEIPGGILVDEWKINLDENNMITLVERRLDVPQEL